MAAIYMWPVEDQIILTTTLYPVEVVEGLQFGISLDSGRMEPIPMDYLEYTQDIIGGSYIQKRWFYTDGPYIESLEYTQDIIGGSYIQKRWFYVDGPYEESVEYTQDVIGGTYIRKKIEADSTDESLQLSVTIGTCSMGLI